MHKNIIITIFVIAGLLSMACSKNGEDSSNSYSKDIDKVTMEAKGFIDENSKIDTRTSFIYTQGSGTVFSWNATDTVGIFPNEGDQVNFAISDGAGTSTCVFDGGGWGLKGNSQYMAYYPFSRDNYVSMGKKKDIRLSYLGESQESKDKIDLGKYDYMAATASAPIGSTVKFNFSHLNTLVVLDVTFPFGRQYTKLELSTTNNKFITEGTIDLTNGTLSIHPISSSNCISLNLGNIAINAGEKVRFYMMIAPTDLSDEVVTVTAYTKYVNYSSTIASKKFKPGYTAYIEVPSLERHYGKYISEKYGNGIVFWDSEDGKDVKLVSTTEPGDLLPWGNATDWCHNYGSNGDKQWYMPSIDELKLLHDSYSEINAALIQNSGTKFSDDKFYWSSTKYNSEHAYREKLSTGEIQCQGDQEITSYKTSTVRAIRLIQN